MVGATKEGKVGFRGRIVTKGKEKIILAHTCIPAVDPRIILIQGGGPCLVHNQLKTPACIV